MKLARLASAPRPLLPLLGLAVAIAGPWACGSSGDGGPGSTTGGNTGYAGAGGVTAGGVGTTGGSSSGGAPAAGGALASGGVSSGGAPVSGGGPSSGGVAGASSGGANTGGAGTAGASSAGTSSGGANTGGTGAGGGSAQGGGAGVSQGGAGGVGNGGSGGLGGGSSGAGGGSCATQPAVSFGKNVRLNDDTGKGNQSEVTLATGPDGLAIAGWMDARAERVCAFTVSKDGGATWSKNVSIANSGGAFVGDPAVAIDAGGTIYAVCQQYIDTGNTGQIRLMTSTDKGATWSSIRSVQSAPDKPWAGGGTSEGTVFLSWLGNAAGIKRSLDRGQTWGPTQSLGNIIHGTAITATTSGLVHVPYNLDSANNQLRYVRSTDGGATWERARDLLANMGSFCFSCNPRQHPIVGGAADPTGNTVAITWTSRMTGGQNDDDVWLLYSKDGGTTWTNPLRVNDNTAASRQFQSWVAVDACGRVHVAWTDLRNGQNETWYARSADPTKGFEPNIQVTDGRGSANTDFLGDYKGIAVLGSDVLVVWMDTRLDSGDIYFARAIGAAGR